MKRYLDVDVSQGVLDVDGLDKALAIPNDESSIESLLTQVKSELQAGEIILVCETSGGYEKPWSLNAISKA